MSSKQPERIEQTPCAITVQNPRFHEPMLADFRSRHPQWLEALEGVGPVYRLPRATITGLKRPAAGRSPILDDSQSRVEEAFAELCEHCNAIAYWNGRFVNVPYLGAATPLAASPEMKKQLGWSDGQWAAAKKLKAMGHTMEARLKGCAGWLITEPAFLKARDDLAARWCGLPAESRPAMIHRSLKLPRKPENAVMVSDEVAQFSEDLNAFLDHWGLTCMYTWDLPAPQGPLLPATLASQDTPAMPKHGLHIVLPLHYPLTGTDDLLRQIRQLQGNATRGLGIDSSMAGLPHWEVYGQMLDVDLLERTIRSRYGGAGRRSGLVMVMEHTIAETLERSENQIKRLRKGIARCRAGRRTEVPWLR
jgi:hypothetical protein